MSDSLNNEKLIQIATQAFKTYKRQSLIKNLVLIPLIVIVIIVLVQFIISMISNFSSLSENIGQNSNPTKALYIQETPHVAGIRLKEIITDQTVKANENFIPMLEELIKNKNVLGITILANSPGGSPVQSALVYDAIEKLKTQYNKEVIVVVEDVCASGCYYIASAADKIFANKASVIGSIGVRMDSFGIGKLMEKIGVENRTLQAGKYKTALSPYTDLDPAATEFYQTQVLDKMHKLFIADVKKGRGERLKSDTKNLFSGLIWLGEDAREIGLIDNLLSMNDAIKQEFDTDQIIFYPQANFWEELTSSFSVKLIQSIEGVKFR